MALADYLTEIAAFPGEQTSMSTDLRAPLPRTAVAPVQVSPAGRRCAPGDSSAETVDWRAILPAYCMVVNGSDGLAAVATDSQLVRNDLNVKQ
jgi:hypothetical protein